MAERGARVYAANGCVYCHSQQVRADYAGVGYRAKMGRPPQRAARLHFRATGVARENAHGPGPCEHRRTRAKGRGKPFAHGRGKSCATRSGGLPGRRSLGEGGQSAAVSCNFSFTRKLACGRGGNIARCYCIETADQPRSGESFHLQSLLQQQRLRAQVQPRLLLTAYGRTTVARANGGIAANVFRCLASRASLFAAQYQF